MKIIKAIKNWIKKWVIKLTELDIVPVTPENNIIYGDFADGIFTIKAKEISGFELKQEINHAVSLGAAKIIIQANVTGRCDRLFEALMHNKVDVDLSQMYTKGVTDMYCMFLGCMYLKRLDLSHWDTSSVTDMCYMFDGCISLKELNLSGWDVGKVQSMKKAFNNCYNLEWLDLSGWRVSAETEVNRLFDDCGKLAEIITEDEKILNLNPPTNEYRFNWSYPGGAYGTKYFFSSDEEAEDIATGMVESYDEEYYIIKVGQPPFYSR